MITLEEAQQKILGEIVTLPSEIVSIWDAEGRVVSKDALSRVDLPVFDNSAMDGYALRASDQGVYGETGQLGLRVVGEVPAGAAPNCEVQEGCCVRVFTGSMLPAGADAVIMQEDVIVQERVEGSHSSIITIKEHVKPWENVRFQGEEIKSGAVIFQKGGRLKAESMALLSHAGVDKVKVTRRPIVAILATGAELIEPGQPLGPGQIYESARLAYAALLKEAGAEPRIYPIIPDTLEDTCNAFKNAFEECDWVLTSGGVSVGDYDFVKAAFEAIGGNSVFWKISMKPGKPFGMGRLNSGKLWFGAPGNPVSGLVSFHLLVAPAVRHALGIPATSALPVWRIGTLGSGIQNTGNRRHFMRGIMDLESRITPLPKQASHRLSSMSGSDLLIDIPPASALEAGAKINYTFFN